MIHLHKLTVKEIKIAAKKAKNKRLGKGECALCGKWAELENHEAIRGKNRKLSIYFGLNVQIGPECHRRLTENPQLDEPIKAEMQKKFMRENPEYDFEELFGINYLKRD
jgi:hypothetical protein